MGYDNEITVHLRRGGEVGNKMKLGMVNCRKKMGKKRE
jgi:hypothetical protein